jgi:hypothetical protein
MLCAYCREKKDWYDSALSLVRKMTQMSARLDRDNHKLYVDIVVANKMTRESLPYTIGVDLCPESGALKVRCPYTLCPIILMLDVFCQCRGVSLFHLRFPVVSALGRAKLTGLLLAAGGPGHAADSHPRRGHCGGGCPQKRRRVPRPRGVHWCNAYIHVLLS